MKKIELTEEQQLQKRLDQIRKAKDKETVDKLLPEYQKRYVGKYFKFRNSFGCGSGWWEYVHVTGLNSAWPVHNGDALNCRYKGVRFAVDSHGVIEIEPVKSEFINHLKKEITEQEFNTAWNKMIDKMAHITK